MTTRTATIIRRRRLEAGLSIRELADIVGCRVGAVQSIENAGDLGNWPLRLVAQLREALALDWSELVAETETPEPVMDDAERLGAELVRTGRLRQVDVSAAGLAAALPAFQEQLLKVGMTLSVGGSGEMRLIAADGPAPVPRLFDEVSDRMANGNLTAPEREVVLAVIAGTFDAQRLSAAKTRALAALLRAGFIGFVDGQHAVVGALAEALGEPLAEPPASDAGVAQRTSDPIQQPGSGPDG